jgi:hypothetical protein
VTAKGSFLLRYTGIDELEQILLTKKLKLKGWDHWEDKNDVYGLSTFKKCQSYKKLFIKCLTDGTDTYHHWRIYSSPNNRKLKQGVCIEFHREKLVSYLQEAKEKLKIGNELFYNSVTYEKLNEFHRRKIVKSEIPFFKRYSFFDEKEFRIIFASKMKSKKSYFDLPIGTDCIRKVRFNPWLLDKPLPRRQKGLENRILQHGIKVGRSKLLFSKQWCNRIDSVL